MEAGAPITYFTKAIYVRNERRIMEAIIFIGLQASGKSTFFKQRFFDTHVRINLDMLKTHARENMLLQACLGSGQPFVVDKMNYTIGHRRRYIESARAAGFRVIGYYFQSRVSECLARNAARSGPRRIPDAGILSIISQLERPSPAEGFDELYHVHIGERGKFVVTPWREDN